MNVVERMAELAMIAHNGVNRVGTGNVPYVVHPHAVVCMLKSWGYTEVDDPVTLAVAWGHDVLEDTDMPEERIRDACGELAERILDGLHLLTFKPSVPSGHPDYGNVKTAYIEHVAQTAPAEILPVKIADRLCNDKSEELISLYRAIKSQDERVLHDLEQINSSWKKTSAFVDEHPELKGIYERFRTDESSMDETKTALHGFVKKEFDGLVSCLGRNSVATNLYEKELQRNVTQKFWRMKKIETERNRMPEKDLVDNIRTDFMGSLYMYYRGLYNGVTPVSESMKVALFVFMRNYAYSGMFRYNAKGEFNVPYGGIGYNGKTLDKKIACYRSKEVKAHLSHATIECLDFEEFFHKHPPHEDDFVFLDPPYDSEISTYAKNTFGRTDQERLASYLMNECKGKWLMVIKYTPFIYSLYDGHGLKIRSFDKKYQVSFMNRNDRNVQHLIITNY